MGYRIVYIEEDGEKRPARPGDTINMHIFRPFVYLANYSFPTGYMEDCGQGDLGFTKKSMSLSDFVKYFSVSHTWECFDTSFDNTRCSLYVSDNINRYEGGSDFHSFFYGDFYCFGVLRSRYHRVLDLYAIKVSDKINDRFSITDIFYFITYNDFKEIFNIANVRLPINVNATRLFSQSIREFTSYKYKFCGILSSDSYVDIHSRESNEESIYFFVLAKGDKFFTVTEHELRLLVVFNAVDGLCLDSGYVYLTERAQQEFHTKSVIGINKYISNYPVSWCIPQYGYYNKYDKRIAILNGFYPSWGFERELIPIMHDAGLWPRDLARILMCTEASQW